MISAHKQIQDLKDRIKQLETHIKKPKTIWDLKYGDEYWVLYSIGPVKYIWYGNSNTELDRYCGNCFLTEAEAKKEYDRRVLVAELKRIYPFTPDWDDKIDEKKCYISKVHGTFESNFTYSIKHPHNLYFKDEKTIEEIIKKYGDRLNVLFD